MHHFNWINQSFLGAGTAFIAASALIPMLNGPAQRIGLTDDPCHRKRHFGSVPLTGGLAMFLAVILAMLVKGNNLVNYSSLLAGMTVLLILGMIDDRREVRALIKLMVQIGVASMAVLWGGMELTQLGALLGPGYGPVGLGPFSVPFSIACIVFLINVVNMADGVDGLAGGTGFLFFAGLAVIAWLGSAPPSLITVSITMAAATAGFLVWNMRFPFRDRASGFMGDAGSMMLGFAAAWLAIAVATHGGRDSVYPVSVAWLLLIPAMDTVALTFRRISQGKSPMAPDRSHLHHLLSRSGFSVTATVGLIHLAVVVTGLLGIAGWMLGLPEWLMFAVAAAAFVGYTLLLLNAHRLLRWRLRLRRRQA